MENLRPIQRIAVIAICLAMTAVLALLLVPWVSEQLESRLEDLPDLPKPAEATPTPTSVSFMDTQPFEIQLGNTDILKETRRFDNCIDENAPYCSPFGC